MADAGGAEEEGGGFAAAEDAAGPWVAVEVDRLDAAVADGFGDGDLHAGKIIAAIVIGTEEMLHTRLFELGFSPVSASTVEVTRPSERASFTISDCRRGMVIAAISSPAPRR